MTIDPFGHVAGGRQRDKRPGVFFERRIALFDLIGM